MELTHKTGVADREAHRPDYKAWATRGAIGGIIAGLAFAAFEVIIAGIIAGNFFSPFRMISATALGSQALTPQVSLGMAIAVGVLVHMAYSIVAGAVIGLILASFKPLSQSKTAVIVSASVLGLLMWLVNFYLIAPAFGWVWFPERASQFWQGFVAHTFLYGTVLGWYISAALKE